MTSSENTEEDKEDPSSELSKQQLEKLALKCEITQRMLQIIGITLGLVGGLLGLMGLKII